jgi:hypothetical protein
MNNTKVIAAAPGFDFSSLIDGVIQDLTAVGDGIVNEVQGAYDHYAPIADRYIKKATNYIDNVIRSRQNLHPIMNIPNSPLVEIAEAPTNARILMANAIDNIHEDTRFRGDWKKLAKGALTPFQIRREIPVSYGKMYLGIDNGYGDEVRRPQTAEENKHGYHHPHELKRTERVGYFSSLLTPREKGYMQRLEDEETMRQYGEIKKTEDLELNDVQWQEKAIKEKVTHAYDSIMGVPVDKEALLRQYVTTPVGMSKAAFNRLSTVDKLKVDKHHRPDPQGNLVSFVTKQGFDVGYMDDVTDHTLSIDPDQNEITATDMMDFGKGYREKWIDSDPEAMTPFEKIVTKAGLWYLSNHIRPIDLRRTRKFK